MPPIRRLALVVNAQKPGAHALGRELAALARAAGVAVKRTARFPLPPGWLRGQDACCVIGGDGTLLGVVRAAATAQVPVPAQAPLQPANAEPAAGVAVNVADW